MEQVGLLVCPFKLKQSYQNQTTMNLLSCVGAIGAIYGGDRGASPPPGGSKGTDDPSPRGAHAKVDP